MPNTFIEIATVTVGAGGATSIDFTSIPQTYDNLMLKLSLRSSTTTIDTKMEFNGITTGYSRTSLTGSGAAAGFGSASDAWVGATVSSAHTANAFSSSEIFIPNYTLNVNKMYSTDSVSENNATTAYQLLNANLWSNTNAITSIKFSGLTTAITFVQHSTATLYGIKNS